MSSAPRPSLFCRLSSLLVEEPTAILSPRDEEMHTSLPNPCPPTLFPSPPRYIPTPYGTIFTTEFGVLSGPKILFFTGISTSSAIFHPLALALSSTHRLLLFDLYGRGYSDSPTHTRFDERLFITQALYAISGSPLSWSRFSLLGYSFGGSLAVSFAEFFPSRIEKLILLAPCGVGETKDLPFGQRLSRLGVVPTWLEKWAARRRSKIVAKLYAGKETPGRVSMAALVSWQTKHHRGYFEAFVKSWRQGGMFGREEAWRRVGNLGIETTVLLGEVDTVVPMEMEGKIRGLLGGERVKVEVVQGAAHDMVTMMPEEVGGFVKGLWKEDEVVGRIATSRRVGVCERGFLRW